MKVLKVILAWALVGIPMVFGISQTLAKVTALFG